MKKYNNITKKNPLLFFINKGSEPLLSTKNRKLLSDPLDDIYLCFKEGLISLELKERLIREVLEINKQSIK